MEIPFNESCMPQCVPQAAGLRANIHKRNTNFRNILYIIHNCVIFQGYS